jgi:hypothetical protein
MLTVSTLNTPDDDWNLDEISFQQRHSWTLLENISVETWREFVISQISGNVQLVLAFYQSFMREDTHDIDVKSCALAIMLAGTLRRQPSVAVVVAFPSHPACSAKKSNIGCNKDSSVNHMTSW